MTVLPFRSGREPPKSERSQMETKIYTVQEIGAWRVPPFQRPLRVNEKVHALSEDLKHSGGIMPGVITLGTVKGDSAIYIVDGQHRLEAFRISALKEFLVDVRFRHYDTMADMAEDFVLLNSSLVKMRPDDILRGLESSVKALQKIRRECKFVGYDQIRRSSATSPLLGMSLTLRCWAGSLGENPSTTGDSRTAASIAQSLTEDSTEDLIQFLTVAESAWGRDAEYARLWSSLNLALCMWLWRRLVKDRDRSGNKRYALLGVKQFSAAMMSLSADSAYLVWLEGRKLRDLNRGPCYGRIKRIMIRRLQPELGRKMMFPQPAWATK